MALDYASFIKYPAFRQVFETNDSCRKADIEFVIQNEAAPDVSQKKAGSRYERAVFYLAAHKLALSDRDAQVLSQTPVSGAGAAAATAIPQGQVTSWSTSMGSQSASINPIDPDKKEAYYAQTPFGTEFLRIYKKIKICPSPVLSNEYAESIL